MKGELRIIIDKASEGGFWAICPEVPGANGQGETIEEAKENLKEAVELILEDRREGFRQELSEDAVVDTIAIE
ncbi:MAG: type II toxin-antitoxin system HicB family antitoxin [Bacteroidales bacterium]|jgi:predicted RNase H-like HicB family nuclease|nr:type II toxin-antitoxin system HicB family antitoxin [Bacteroidales bacterium]NCU36662.1 type II toxin-antitoxin system HicB family antitoxin [Candidatus Falkowbacteria bacterium]MDD2633136.1 type II toxin-antitoxin system HicB family antitoxin [Bacteroidales bacterium]MDD4177777.1 type II toxin-antitoxin system HicB family antitoxin [Bacteroidales bacterium]MDD4742151.1 type II toxin-antitoxin system HicB family antitoxin [Bacteroidales bacterium]